jgi:galactoside O-acetyltransferase
MAFLQQVQLDAIGFKSLGRGVQISDRAAIHGAHQIEIGDYSRIDDFCVIAGNVSIGRNVHIAVACNVAGGEPGIRMDDFSGLAHGCHVFTHSDDYSGMTLTNPTVPDQYKQVTKKPVQIGRHCIVGSNSLVFPGVSLANGTAVGAMSMVTKSTKPWSVYFGIPAKRLKARSNDLLELEEAYLNSETSP